jgi:hypothetical protein
MTLKDCLYRTLHQNHKPLKAIAEELSMSVSYLTRTALPDQEESDTGSGCNFPLKKLIPLVHATGDFTVLDFIEQSLGRMSVVLPDPSANISDICRLTMTSVREFGHMMSEIESGIADGKITERERERILKEGHEAIQAIMNLIYTLKASRK